MWLAIFLIVVFCLVLFPLMPSLMELAFATDVEPLKVIQEYDINIKHFAMGYKTYITRNFSSFFAETQSAAEPREGTLRDGTGFQIASGAGGLNFNKKEASKFITDRMIISGAPLALPGGMTYETEIYSKEAIRTGDASSFRAMLAEGDIELGKECTVVRWIHSGATLFVGSGSRLFGRASAEENIVLANNCSFERLNAKRIVLGDDFAESQIVRRAPQKTLTEIPNAKDVFERRWLINGDVIIEANSIFDGDIVATKSVVIGAGATITGSIKSNKDMHLAQGVQVTGSLVCAGNLHMEKGCQVAGPVIAEDSILIETGCVIGAEEAATTLSAPQIHIVDNAVVFGTIWADEEGSITKLPASERNS